MVAFGGAGKGAIRRGGPTDRLLPEGRLAGPMPWVVAIMIFLTMLSCAAGVALGEGAAALARASADRLTVQVANPDPAAREADVAAISTALRAIPGVSDVREVPRQDLLDQLEPWLGGDFAALDIPVPALIDVELAGDDSDRALVRDIVARTVAGITAGAGVEAHADYLRPVTQMVRTIGWIALAIVVLMAVATGFVIVLAARGAHATHRDTIAVMHMLGATDEQVARLFQRRMTRDVSFGAVLGFLAALAVMLGVGHLGSLLAGDMLRSVQMPWWGWPLLPALCGGFVLLARIAARWTLRSALRRAL